MPGQETGDVTIAAGPNDGLLGNPDDAFRLTSERRGHAAEEADHQREGTRRHGDRSPANFPQSRARKEILESLADRQESPRGDSPQGQKHPEEEELLRDEENDPGEDENPIQEGADPVWNEPDALTGRRRPFL